MNYLHLYKTFLPCVMFPSMMMSGFIGMDEVMNKSQPQARIMNTFGVLSVGALVGLSYPISIPLLAGRYLYRNRIV